MTTYTPDRWVVLEMGVKGGEPIRKVFAGWYGGYLNGDSWKLSSGITNVREFDDRWEFDNYSGSIYVCYKTGGYGMSGYMSGIYAGWEKEASESPDVSIKVVEEYKGA